MNGTPSDSRLLLYVTPPHECSYLPDREAVTLFADPEFPKDPYIQALLTEQGFRRSGQHLYRPRCGDCTACEAVRIPVPEFTPNRSQRRTWARNQDLTVRCVEQQFREEHFDLYARYVTGRHAGGGMDDPTPEKYEEFLLCPWADTRLLEFREQDELVAVAVSDRLDGALSAVYTFFDPARSARGLGVYAVLWQLHAAQRTGLDWVYLGFTIQGCRKMEYKGRYLPQERMRDGRWVRLER